MKVLHLSDYLSGCHKIWGGAEQICLRILHLLESKNIDINVASTKPLLKPKESRNFFFLNTLENVWPVRLRNFYRRLNTIIPFDPLVFTQFLRLAVRLKPNIIHLHNFKHLTFAVVCVAKLLKIPIIFSIYDYWLFCPKENLLNKLDERCPDFHGCPCIDCFDVPVYFRQILRLRRIFFNLFLNSIDRFIVLSGSCFEIMRQYGIEERKISIIYQPAPFRKASVAPAGPEIKVPFILFVGNLIFNKGAHIAIEALAVVRREVPNIRLYVVGVVEEYTDREFVQRLKRRVKEERLEKAVLFLNRIAPEKMPVIFSQAEAVLIPEQWPNMSPVVLIEAMTAGIPIVAARSGGLAEFIKDGQNGFLAPPQDSAQFAQRVIWILKNPQAAEKLGAEAKMDARKIWDDRANITKLVELYESLLE